MLFTPFPPGAGLIAIRLSMAIVLLAGSGGSWAQADEAPLVTVYKQISCRCCEAWVSYLRRGGFPVDVRNVADVRPYRRNFGVADRFGACHTALVQSRHRVLEGHVPLREIRRLLEEHADQAVIAVPGMPQGSPGMAIEGRYAEPYEVLRVYPDGEATVYAIYAAVRHSDTDAVSRAAGRISPSPEPESYVVKAALHGLLALLLGAGVMAIARAHARHDDQGRRKRLPSGKRRHRSGEVDPQAAPCVPQTDRQAVEGGKRSSHRSAGASSTQGETE